MPKAKDKIRHADDMLKWRRQRFLRAAAMLAAIPAETYAALVAQAKELFSRESEQRTLADVANNAGDSYQQVERWSCKESPFRDDFHAAASAMVAGIDGACATITLKKQQRRHWRCLTDNQDRDHALALRTLRDLLSEELFLFKLFGEEKAS